MLKWINRRPKWRGHDDAEFLAEGVSANYLISRHRGGSWQVFVGEGFIGGPRLDGAGSPGFESLAEAQAAAERHARDRAEAESPID